MDRVPSQKPRNKIRQCGANADAYNRKYEPKQGPVQITAGKLECLSRDHTQHDLKDLASNIDQHAFLSVGPERVLQFLDVRKPFTQIMLKEIDIQRHPN